MALVILILGVIMMVIALMTQWSITFGIGAIICFVCYFGLLNTGAWLAMGLFALGMILIVLELLLPTFGLLALIGAGAMYGSFYLSTGTWQEALIAGTAGIVVGGISAYVLAKLGYRLPFMRRLVLHTANQPLAPKMLATDENSAVRRARTVTALHPVGKIRLANGQLVDARAESGYIPPQVEVIVLEQREPEWVVRRHG